MNPYEKYYLRKKIVTGAVAVGAVALIGGALLLWQPWKLIGNDQDEQPPQQDQNEVVDQVTENEPDLSITVGGKKVDCRLYKGDGWTIPVPMDWTIEEKGEAEALRFMGEEFDVSPQKLALAKEIVDIQRPFMQGIGNGADVYIGIPFCRTRCLYCSFLSEVRTKKTDMAAYIDALKKDIRLGAAILRDSGYHIRSMYMGGGTPTVLTEDELKDVLEYAMEQYGGYGDEFTVEAGRPDTITKEKLRVIRSMGAGRISINPQTMCGRTLELVGRSHSPEEIVRAYHDARELGFDSINMDVIAGLPGENLADVKHTLEEIKRLDPDNLTVHTLAIKRSSKLKGMLDEYSLPDADEAEAMVNAGMQAAEDMGMKPYYMYRQKYMRGNLENVGYAKPGTECMYNIDMMEETVSIMAHGAGAMTKRIFDGECRVERIPNPKDIATYIAKVDAVAEEKRSLYSK